MSVNGEDWKESFDNENGPVKGGRKYHNVKDSSYWLPKDEDEQVRLNGFHFAFKKMFDGNLFPEAYEFTNFEKGVKCVDVGCGPGSFVMDMAVEYPNSHFHGLDIAAMFDSQVKLPNTEFGLGNVLTGLPFPDNSIDFVHMRLFMVALRREEWPIALKEVFRIIKPGGGIHLCEVIEEETGNENTKEVFHQVYGMMRKYNQVPEAGNFLEEWLKDTGFNSVMTDIRTVDFGDGTPYAKQWAWVWGQSLTSALPILAGPLGIEDGKMDEYLKNHIQELCDSHASLTFKRCMARKPLD